MDHEPIKSFRQNSATIYWSHGKLLNLFWIGGSKLKSHAKKFLHNQIPLPTNLQQIIQSKLQELYGTALTGKHFRALIRTVPFKVVGSVCRRGKSSSNSAWFPLSLVLAVDKSRFYSLLPPSLKLVRVFLPQSWSRAWSRAKLSSGCEK